MNKRALIALSLAALLQIAAGPALANGGEEKEDENGQSVLISPVALPVIIDGKLVNYVFVTVRLDLTMTANTPKLREKEPYFRDALVRLAHRTPFTVPTDLTKIDEARLRNAMLREAQAIGGTSVRSVVVVSQAPKSTRVRR